MNLPGRIFATVYFQIAILALSACGYLVLASAIGLLRLCLPKSESRDHLQDRVGSFISDSCIKLLLSMIEWIVKLEIVGPCGAPNQVMQDKAWQRWRGHHSQYIPETLITRCVLPRSRGGRIVLPPGCLVVSNHLSNLDGFCLKAATFPAGSKALMKGNITKLPILGPFGKLLDEPFVHFTANRGGWEIRDKDKLMNRCLQIIRRKFPLIVYPEGVRRKYGRMAPFRLGMIKFAIANSIPIYPLVIHQSDIAWPANSMLMDSATVYLSFNESCILPNPGDNPELVSKLLIQQMVLLLRQIPTYDANMAWVTVTNVTLKSLNPAPLSADFAFELSFLCLHDLTLPLHWRLIYVGSADDKSKDQEIESVELGPVKRGSLKFTFEADPPDFSKIDSDDIWGTTVLLLEGSYRNQDFVRIGWYIHNVYTDPLLQDDPPDVPQLDKMVRYIVADEPRVTGFNINWAGQTSELCQTSSCALGQMGLINPLNQMGLINPVGQGNDFPQNEVQMFDGQSEIINPHPGIIARDGCLAMTDQVAAAENLMVDSSNQAGFTSLLPPDPNFQKPTERVWHENRQNGEQCH